MLGIHDYWLFVATGVLLNLTPGQEPCNILAAALLRVGTIAWSSLWASAPARSFTLLLRR